MSIIVYPSTFQQKILAEEAPGGTPRMLNLIIPSVTTPSMPFDISVVVLDGTGYPSLQCEGNVTVRIPQLGTVDVSFQHGIPAVARLEGIRLLEEGLFRLSAYYDDLTVHSNPTLCTSEQIPRIYWGDPHVHTYLSNCHPETCRSMNFCFTAARHVSALDWVAAADHVSNRRGDISKWKEQQAVANLYNDDLAFVTVPAYEASLQGGAGGDNNVYMSRWPDMFVDEYENGNVKSLCTKLADKLRPDEFFVVPHHTTRANKHGEISDEIYPGPDAMPVIEIHSKWGTSEYRGNPNPLKRIHDGPSYAVDFLHRGMKLGFIAGTDTHATLASGGGDEPGHIDRLPGLTAVRNNNLTRQSVFDSIRSRQCYAASLERIIMHGSIAGHTLGDELHFTELTYPLRIDVLVAARSDIARIELVRNGETIYAISPDTWQTRFLFDDDADLTKESRKTQCDEKFVYYYVRVTCKSGGQAWSSPVWIVE